MIWSKHDIKTARQVILQPLLKKLGYRLRKLERGNYLVEKHASVIVKDNYWFDKKDQSSGNAIDFFTIVDGRSFNDAMAILITKK